MRLRRRLNQRTVRLWPSPCLHHICIFGLPYEKALRIAQDCRRCVNGSTVITDG